MYCWRVCRTRVPNCSYSPDCHEWRGGDGIFISEALQRLQVSLLPTMLPQLWSLLCHPPLGPWVGSPSPQTKTAYHWSLPRKPPVAIQIERTAVFCHHAVLSQAEKSGDSHKSCYLFVLVEYNCLLSIFHTINTIPKIKGSFRYRSLLSHKHEQCEVGSQENPCVLWSKAGDFHTQNHQRGVNEPPPHCGSWDHS
jgi:hypothetical protein